eukprot:superscaffoldBa00002000_g12805
MRSSRHRYRGNFQKLTPSSSTTFNAPYDYLSVMHYGKSFFSKNSGITIATKLPQYQDKIGQRIEMSQTDVYKLNRLYNCNASVSFMEHCNFSDVDICGMSYCEKGLTKGWKRVSTAAGGPFTDHTNLDKMGGKEGDSAWLETRRMSPSRECHVQCLQFFYYHSGSESDQLNIWIREFQDERDSTGNLRLMGQITGEPTFDWQYYRVPLNAAKPFQAVFEVHNGNEDSSGGFSIDDINLSESECPHNIWQVENFERLLTTTDYNSYLYSPRVYSPEGYAYQMVIALRETFFGVYFRLVSGDYDSTLEWPCPWRQLTFIMLDKNPHIQQQMSKQITLTTDPSDNLLHDDILMPQGTQRSSINNVDALWPSPVPYVLDQSLEMNAKGVVLKALDQFRLKSCIDFKPRDSEEYYISVQKDDGCYSYIGRVLPNGQVLSIGHYCDDLSIAEHEFLHALGFFHEQSRYDRDDYVTIVPENIIEGFERNFRKASAEDSTTHGVPYDYWSVMHYGADFFSNGNGSTIITKDPKFQNVIGQRLEVSSSDVRELNLLYRCNSTIAFKMYCGFTNGTMCQMDRCSRSDIEWEMTTHIASGPMSDHTGGSEHGQDEGYFMHASTTLGKEGDSATLQTKRMRPSRDCHIQCLQFYYYHNGNESDELNIWIREFQDEHDFTGKVRLMGQITGPPTSHWQLQHVSLDATKHFQVEFVVRKGAGSSVGGFSIDDINLSEIECPHVTLQINDFEKLLNTSYYGTTIYSPRQYSRGGYAYRVGAILYETFFGVFVQLLSGKYDDELEWPCPHRQVTFQIRDQNPNIQLQMSKQKSITSDPSATNDDGTYVWDDPHLTPLINGSALPCPEVGSVKLRHLRKEQDDGPCSPQIATTTPPNPETRDPSIFGFSPAMVSSPVLTLLPALMLLAR